MTETKKLKESWVRALLLLLLLLCPAATAVAATTPTHGDSTPTTVVVHYQHPEGAAVSSWMPGMLYNAQMVVYAYWYPGSPMLLVSGLEFEADYNSLESHGERFCKAMARLAPGGGNSVKTTGVCLAWNTGLPESLDGLDHVRYLFADSESNGCATYTRDSN